MVAPPASPRPGGHRGRHDIHHPHGRVWTAIRPVQPDRTLYQINFTTPARRKLAECYGATDLDHLIGNHTAKHRARPPDELGIVWHRIVDHAGYHPRGEHGRVH